MSGLMVIEFYFVLIIAGVVLYEMLARKVPYHDLTLPQVAAKVIGGSISLIPEITDAPEGTHPAVLVKVQAMCLQPEPQFRPEFEEILQMIEKEEHKVHRKKKHSLP